MDSAERAGNVLENALSDELTKTYAQALEKALENQKTFLKKLEDLDERAKTLPSDWSAEKIASWKQGYQNEYLRRYSVTQSIATELANAGTSSTASIDKMLQEVYSLNNAYTVNLINKDIDIAFDLKQTEQIKNILDESQGSFTKLAYQNMGNDKVIVKELSSQLAQATMLGESQAKIISRIKKVTGQKTWQAKRVAQTERT